MFNVLEKSEILREDGPGTFADCGLSSAFAWTQPARQCPIAAGPCDIRPWGWVLTLHVQTPSTRDTRTRQNLCLTVKIKSVFIIRPAKTQSSFKVAFRVNLNY